MELNLLLEKELIVLDENICSKDKVVKNLVDKLYQSGKIREVEKFYQKVMNNKQKGYNAIGNGIIISCTQSEVVKEPSLALLRTDNDLDCQSLDGTPARLYLIVAVPDDSDIHLSTLSRLARKLKYQDFRELLFNASNAEEIISIMRGEKNAS